MSTVSTNPVQNKVVTNKFDQLDQEIDAHVKDYNNPHEVSAEQIGAATAKDLDAVKKNINSLVNDPYKILRDLAIVSTGGIEITDLLIESGKLKIMVSAPPTI